MSNSLSTISTISDTCYRPFLSDLSEYRSLGLRQMSGFAFDQPFNQQNVKRAFLLFTGDAVKESERETLFAQAHFLKDSGYDLQASVIKKVEDICSSLKQVMRKLPSGEKIDILAINGHGYRDGIEMRSTVPGARQIWWGENSILNPLKCFENLSKDAVIALNSCYTGQRPFPTSFAAYLSKASERKVFAPEVEMNQNSFFDISMMLRRFKAKKPAFNSLCQAINSYKNGHVDFESQMNIRSYKKCLHAFDKATQLGLIQKDDVTPLMLAAQDFPEAAQPLIQAGADVNVASKQGSTALMFATLKNHPSTVEALVNARANVNVHMEDGLTALMLAAQYCPKAVQPLIKAGANVSATHRNGATALVMAIMSNHPSAVQALVDAGANVNARFEGGLTALILAAQFSPASVRPLIKAGADVNAFTSNGATALEKANHFNPAVAQDLIDAGAEVQLQTVAKSDKGYLSRFSQQIQKIKAFVYNLMGF